MYAVFKSGGKQYRVSTGEKLTLEKLGTEVGKKVVFDEILSVGEGRKINIGTPFLVNATVEAKVLEEGKGKKIEVVKFKRRKNYKRNFGHRQTYSLIEITAINVKKKAAPKKTKASPKKTKKQTEK